ncbi:hypothetical protein C8A01DRAFT_32470 [Parachaetomium inaequale]|uniref:Myb-like domain-containing protein n=1 Tax=Parachaetomium inaequale TaxID=2588326 RepID=A0AAN6SV97_9PEZI|nr:hypothetical protein C8A01DRAFT_32470 [Parachaetomium inaequale]
MDSDHSSGHGAQDTSRLRESVSMALRQLQQPQPARAHSDEIPESEDGEAEDDGNDDDDNEDDGNANSDDEVIDDDLDEPPQRQRRHSISSAGSHYNPSAASSEADLAAEAPDHHSLQPALPLPLKTTKSHLPSSSPYSTVPPTPTQTYRSSPRKRSLSPTSPRHHHHHPNTEEREREPSPRPFKRHKSTPLNPAYLTLLNADILDAAHRYTPNDDTNLLEPSQVGLTHWTGAEKTLLFEALARLGGGGADVTGIASRVRTKGVLEVGAYLSLLRGAPPPPEKESVAVEEMPAAVELSQACCAALEEAADAVSVRQEGHEEGVERRKWGGEGWLVGVGNWRALEAAPPEGLAGCLGLLRVGSWLRLSGRVFMNSVVEEYNWARVEGEEPAVRATALEDFYALAVEVTRRLVAATIFVGEARVKARRELYPESRNRVWKQDVEAAALSLGLPTNSRRFWAKCARRLRLDVYEHEDAIVAGWDDKGEQEPMSYDEVERALGLGPEATEGDTAAADEETESSEEEELDQEDQPSAAESDNGSVELGAETPHASEYEEPLPEEDETEKQAVTREMNELLVHSALEYPKTGKPRSALRTRIRAERAREAYADKLDAKASYYEEKRMWAMLERQPPMELVKPDVPEGLGKLTKRTVDDLIKGFARTPGDWRDKLEVVASRWEMDYALAQGEKQEAKEAIAAAKAESGDQI